MKTPIILLLTAAVIGANLGPEEKCRETILAEPDTTCEDVLEIEDITQERFQKLNPKIKCDNPEEDTIPEGTEICVKRFKRCGMLIRTDKDKTCGYYMDMNPSISITTFRNWNPHITCNNRNTDILPEGEQICLHRISKFDNEKIEGRTTYDDFLKAAQPRQRSVSKAWRDLYNKMVEVGKVLSNPRSKREAINQAELQQIDLFTTDDSVKLVEGAFSRSKDFKTLQDEYNHWRTQICGELSATSQEYDDYHRCVCVDKKPYINCQALFAKHQLEAAPPTIRVERSLAEEYASSMVNLTRQLRKTDGKNIKTLYKLLTKGCPTSDCMNDACFTADHCQPIPKLIFLSLCVEAEACFPGYGHLANVEKWMDAKFAAKVRICLSKFADFLSWLNFEKCFASVILEYYYIKNQAQLTLEVALIVVKASVSSKTQLGPVAKTADGLPAKYCQEPGNSCKDLCLTPAQLPKIDYGYKVEYWWWRWREKWKKDPELGTC